MRSQDMHLFVAALAANRLHLVGIVRTVARDTFGMPLVEKCGLGDKGFFGRMALGASFSGFSRRSMLTRMACSAPFDGIFAFGRVKGGNRFVTGRTRRRLGSCGFVRCVARQAVARAVHHDRFEVSLSLGMAAQAIFGSKWLSVRCLLGVVRERKRMASQAVGRDSFAVLFDGQRACMVRLRLLLVARGTTSRSDRTELSLCHVMTSGARDRLF